MRTSAPVIRGCGTRVQGGIYSITDLSDHGNPVEYYIYDPPQAINPSAAGLAKIGVALTQFGNPEGPWHILDWVSSKHYPNVCDFIEEASRFGMSRRLSRMIDFSLLTDESMHIIIHDRGYIHNHEDYTMHREPRVTPWQEFEDEATWQCPKEALTYCDDDYRLITPKIARDHQGDPRYEYPNFAPMLPDMCASLWWEDVENMHKLDESGRGKRSMPSFSYIGRERPDGTIPSYSPAMVARFPIHRLIVIESEDPEDHEKSLEIAGKAHLPVSLEKE